MAFDSVPFIMDGTTLDGEVIRRALGTLLSAAGGIVTPGDLAVAQQSVPNMSVQIAAGQAWIPGTSTASQGAYYTRNGAAVTAAISTPSPSNPRIDTVIVQVEDAAYAGVNKDCVPAVVAGTPTPGATLVNLTGKGAVPASSLVLAYVLVPTSAVSIVTADIANVAGVLNVAGSRVISAPSGATTLPAPSPGALITIQAASTVTGASPATITYGSGGGKIFGLGLSSSGVSSFPIGRPFASVTLEGDATGANWLIVGGQPDAPVPTQPTRTSGVAYQPSTARPVLLTLAIKSNGITVQLWIGATSSPNSYVAEYSAGSGLFGTLTAVVPPGWYYNYTGSPLALTITETQL